MRRGNQFAYLPIEETVRTLAADSFAESRMIMSSAPVGCVRRKYHLQPPGLQPYCRCSTLPNNATFSSSSNNSHPQNLLRGSSAGSAWPSSASPARHVPVAFVDAACNLADDDGGPTDIEAASGGIGVCVAGGDIARQYVCNKG
ncbi:hypothetical protein NUW58_g558 [Xylaria curta]|uniref:Uncharacterized protein n=1 Tax=Xylaria curta TaxID=42375 RepID=A0ACC1PS62_9PEZI|nr:hypothetical protein NUW58_g558 [Xylaria curta]